MFKVGDKVLIRPDLREDREYRGSISGRFPGISHKMVSLAKTKRAFTIKEVRKDRGDYFILKEDHD